MKVIDLLKNNQDYFEDFITRSTYHSNSIEGSTISYAETYAIIFNDNSFKVTATPREIFDAINHKYALSKIIEYAETESVLHSGMIIDIAKMINKNINEIGGYRKVPVRIRGAEHIPPAANEIPGRMMYLLDNYNNYYGGNIFEKIAMFHIEFERIHPFEDGNGRTGRLLLNYELLKNDVPPVVIPTERRTDYFNMIANMDIAALSSFFKELSDKEYEHMQTFEIINECRQEITDKPCIGKKR